MEESSLTTAVRSDGMDEPRLGEIRRRKRGGIFLRMAYLCCCLGSFFDHLLGELQSRPAVRAPPWTGQLYQALDRSLFTQVIPNTILVGLGTVITVLFFGFPLAWLLNRTNIPMRAFCISLDRRECDCAGFG